MLKAINIHKIYKNGAKELRVLKGIDLKIDKGEFVSIFGPSGAGKSTLLHILGGLDEPTGGDVFLDGEALYTASGDTKRAGLRNKKIGFVFQFYHLLPEFSAFENVMLPAMIKGIAQPVPSPSLRLLCRPDYVGTPRNDGRGISLAMTSLRAPTCANIRSGRSNLNIAKAQQLLELVGLKDRINHRPSELSGGEQQRVAIARALINEPQLLLCDEPTGNLDSASGKSIIELLYRLNKEEGMTIVVVTHEPQIAKKADRVAHIIDGKLM